MPVTEFYTHDPAEELEKITGRSMPSKKKEKPPSKINLDQWATQGMQLILFISESRSRYKPISSITGVQFLDTLHASLASSIGVLLIPHSCSIYRS